MPSCLPLCAPLSFDRTVQFPFHQVVVLRCVNMVGLTRETWTSSCCFASPNVRESPYILFLILCMCAGELLFIHEVLKRLKGVCYRMCCNA